MWRTFYSYDICYIGDKRGIQLKNLQKQANDRKAGHGDLERSVANRNHR